MITRHPALTKLLPALESVLLARKPEGDWTHGAREAFRALATPRPAGDQAPARLDACRHLDPALAHAKAQGGAEVQAAAEAFAELAPSATWLRRAGSETADPAFHNGHANAILIGPQGIETREDCWLGVSLMAAEVQYPVHRHPPEELYFVLSEGDWYRKDANWFTPGIGGLVYNPSGALHSMRSTGQPLLAFWLLWGGRSLSLHS